ncbi:MAG: ribonuclease Z [Verrucomicrobiales bacterium]|jgi:ribonuclease Z
MTTNVTVTGTGNPYMSATNAGPGVLVHYEADDGSSVRAQFDAGRATAMRLTALGVAPGDLDAIFLTHYHSDHLTGVTDIVLSHWVFDRDDNFAPLVLGSPQGATSRFAERMLSIWDDDLAVRSGHNHRSPEPKVDHVVFPATAGPTEVWSRGAVRVLASQVRHEPVVDAVGYRVETPDGVVVISGDTVVCDEMAVLAEGADVVVYEAMRANIVRERPAHLRYIVDYHADCVEIGRQMHDVGVPNLMLTHLLPPAKSEADFDEFRDQVLEGGYEGNLMVCRDLDTITF